MDFVYNVESKARRNLLESMVISIDFLEKIISLIRFTIWKCLQVEVFPSSFEENLDKNLFADPKDYVLVTLIAFNTAVVFDVSLKT